MTKYALCIAPGCFAHETTVLSMHRSLDAAQRAARKSDRTCVVRFDDGDHWAKKGYKFPLRSGSPDIVYQINQQNDPHYGAGRYGNPAS